MMNTETEYPLLVEKINLFTCSDIYKNLLYAMVLQKYDIVEQMLSHTTLTVFSHTIYFKCKYTILNAYLLLCDNTFIPNLEIIRMVKPLLWGIVTENISNCKYYLSYADTGHSNATGKTERYPLDINILEFLYQEEQHEIDNFCKDNSTYICRILWHCQVKHPEIVRFIVRILSECSDDGRTYLYRQWKRYYAPHHVTNYVY